MAQFGYLGYQPTQQGFGSQRFMPNPNWTQFGNKKIGWGLKSNLQGQHRQLQPTSLPQGGGEKMPYSIDHQPRQNKEENPSDSFKNLSITKLIEKMTPILEMLKKHLSLAPEDVVARESSQN